MLVQSSCLVLDIGCGAGLSGDVLTEQGHVWIGIDIAPAMLEQSLERECEGDVLLRDMGHGLPFRPASFDAAISVSAIQWLLHAYKAEQNPRRRLMAFFQSLYNCLSRGAKAVLQFYPEDPAQMELVTSSAMRCGFTGGLVVDYPNSTRAKKYFLCLFAGESSAPLPQPLGVDEVGEPAHEVAYIKRQQQKRKRMLEGKRASVKSRAWILKKKEKARVKGQVVPKDTKYTGRRRPAAF